jgi:hypothetical protein
VESREFSKNVFKERKKQEKTPFCSEKINRHQGIFSLKNKKEREAKKAKQFQ